MMRSASLSGRAVRMRRTGSSTGRLLLLRCAATATAAFGTIPGHYCSCAFLGDAAVHRAPPPATISPDYAYPSGQHRPSSAFLLPSSRSPAAASRTLVEAGQQPWPRRHLSSSRRNYDYDPDEDPDDNSKKSFLSKAADKVKSFLPGKWFKSDEQKKAEIERRRTRDEITGGIDEVLKGAPLGMRMMGKMVAPLLSKAVSGLGEAMQEQNRRMEDLMDDARRCIVADGAAADALGEPVVVGSPFSQSSSTSSINGRTTVNVQSSFEVMGSRRNGVATMAADGNGIRTLRLDVAGRSYDVNVSGRAGGRTEISGRRKGGSSGGRDNVIDAEIIDADFTEKK